MGVSKFISDKPGVSYKPAAAVCASCPVREECRDYAVKMKCEGVWGGWLFTYDNQRPPRNLLEGVKRHGN